MRKRMISMVLAVSMAVGILPVSAFASGGGTLPDTVTVQEIEQQNSSENYTEITSLSQIDYRNDACKVRLKEDIVMTGSVTIGSGKTLTIDLNGHTLTAPENSVAFYVSGGALTIEDSGSEGAVQGSGTVNSEGGAICLSSDAGSTFILSGGTIRDFAAKYGAGVYMNGGTFCMNGGSIRNCSAASGGGGVYMAGGAFNMSDGTISDCSVTGTDLSGGGVYLGGGTFNMTGGSIENCTAHEGAGVEMYPSDGKATFSMSGSAEIKSCNADGISITAGSNGESEFNMSGGTIENNDGYGLRVSQGRGAASAALSGGSIKDSERDDIYIDSGVVLTASNIQVSGKVLNFGTLRGEGTAEFTGTVENAGAGKITGCKIHRIEDRSYSGVVENSTWDEYFYLIGYSWPEAKIPSEAGGSVSFKFLSYVKSPEMTNALTIPEDVTVIVDLTGKPVSAEKDGLKIINHGTLTLLDSGTDGTLSIPIENDGVLNANGGTVTGEVINKGQIRTTGTTVTKFTGTLVNEENASVTAGDFTDCIITDNGGTIGGDAILNKPEPDPVDPSQPGSGDDGVGAVIAVAAVGTAVVGGGVLLAHCYIQNNLPEGFAVPENRQQLAAVLWNMAGRPEPISQQVYTDVQDEETLKAVRWAVENELVSPETDSTLGADVRVSRLQVLRAMYWTNQRKK